MRFQLAVPLKEAVAAVDVEKLLQLLNLEQCHLDLVLASQHTFGLAAEAEGP